MFPMMSLKFAFDESLNSLRGHSKITQLTEVEGHDEISKIEQYAFCRCLSDPVRVRRVKKMSGVREIEREAFLGCRSITDLEFGDKLLEIIGDGAFFCCKSLRYVSMPSVRRVERGAFEGCVALTDAEFGVKIWIELKEMPFLNAPP